MNLSPRVAFALFLAGLLSPRAFAAPDAPAVGAGNAADFPDAVDMKDGSFLRGVIVEWTPGSHLTIRLPSGELRRVPAGDVRAASRAGQAMKVGPELSAQVDSPEVPRVPSEPLRPRTELEHELAGIPGPRVQLDLSSNRHAILQRRIGVDYGDSLVAYHMVCALPCKAVVPALDPQLYRIGGARAQATPWFKAPAKDAEVRAHLVRDAWQLWPGGALTAGLLLGAIGGAGYGLYAVDATGPWSKYSGLGLLGLGGGFVISSAVLWVLQPESRVAITEKP